MCEEEGPRGRQRDWDGGELRLPTSQDVHVCIGLYWTGNKDQYFHAVLGMYCVCIEGLHCVCI
jgi:hypothetical protein